MRSDIPAVPMHIIIGHLPVYHEMLALFFHNFGDVVEELSFVSRIEVLHAIYT